MKQVFISVVLLIACAVHVEAQNRDRALSNRQSLQEFIERANQLLGIVLNNVNNASQASTVNSAPAAVVSVVESPAESNAVVNAVENNAVAVQEVVSAEQPVAVVAESVIQAVEETVSVNSIT